MKPKSINRPESDPVHILSHAAVREGKVRSGKALMKFLDLS